MRKTLTLFIAAVAACAVMNAAPAKAESAFTHHVDFLQVTTHDSRVKLMDIGYHFTAFRFAKRVDVLGLGGGLDIYSPEDGGFVEDMSPFLTVPLFSIALTDPEKSRKELNPWFSFGANYTYNVNLKEHRVSVGFSVSFQSAP